MDEKLYTWEQVKAFSVITLHNILHSANDVNLKNVIMFIEPLENLNEKIDIIEYAQILVKNEK